MSKILACIDASPYAEAVCKLAAWVAKQSGLRVELLHVIQRKSAVAMRNDLSGAIGLGIKQELLEELTRIEQAQGKLAIEGGRALLAAGESTLKAAHITDIETVHRHGGIVETILEREADAEVVIMGKRGASSQFARGHVGSKIERVLRASDKPMLVAPQQLPALKRAVIAYDGGKSIGRAVEIVRRSKVFDGLAIHLVMAAKDTAGARAQLDQVVAQFAQDGRQASCAIVDGPAEKVIVESVESKPDTMLVMGAYGHSPLRNLIVGSTTTAMIRAVEAPILLVR